jgi:hypothetical protein
MDQRLILNVFHQPRGSFRLANLNKLHNNRRPVHKFNKIEYLIVVINFI